MQFLLFAAYSNDIVDQLARILFFTTILLLPVLGIYLGVCDIRAHLRALRGALVVVRNRFRNVGTPEWIKKETPPSILALGLQWPCSEEEIRTAYRKLAEKNHPDLGGNRQRFLYLQQHFESAIQFVRQHKTA